MRITSEMTRELTEVLDGIRKELFEGRKLENYPFDEWERNREKVREKLRELPMYVEKAAGMIETQYETGRPKKLGLTERTMLFLLTRMLSKSNRDMELMLELFKPLLKVGVSYKSIERLYSDEEVKAVLHNLFILLLKDEDVSGNFSGDGTGYSLSITKHYNSKPEKKGKDYKYVFRLMDLKTGMYTAVGYSNESEMDAFNKAIAMVNELDIEMDSIALDKYYSSRKVLKLFGNETVVYVIPKRNIRKIGISWSRVIRIVLTDPINFLRNYFKRNLSEAGISSDKRRFGWVIRQKRDDRIETATFVTSILHNLFFIRVK
jgi:transposase